MLSDFDMKDRSWQKFIMEMLREARGEFEDEARLSFETDLKELRDKKHRRCDQFWFLLKKYWPEKYPAMAASAVKNGATVPGYEDGQSKSISTRPDHSKVWTNADELDLDYSRWEGKNSTDSGVDWIYNNLFRKLEGPDFDPYSAPQPGNVGHLLAIQNNSKLMEAFLMEYQGKKMTQDNKEQESRFRRLDTAGDVQEALLAMRERFQSLSNEEKGQVQGYA